MANRNWSNGGRLWIPHTSPVLIDCNFVVDSTNGNGLGIRSLKGPMVQNVFMHTTSTPGAGNSNPSSPNVVVTNPNPASGTIIVQFQDNYNRSFSGCNAIVSPIGSSTKVDNSALTIGVAYTIIVPGNSTLAQMQSIGLPIGLSNTVGTTFIATAVGISGEANTSTTRVAPAADAGSGIFSIETVGDPNQSLSPNPSANQGFGGQIILQCRKDSSSDAPTVAAPADGSVISLCFYLSNSSVQVAGE